MIKEFCDSYMKGFNTQPPEGGWVGVHAIIKWQSSFNTQPPEGGWFGLSWSDRAKHFCFNTQPPEGGWVEQLEKDLEQFWFQHTAA